MDHLVGNLKEQGFIAKEVNDSWLIRPIRPSRWHGYILLFLGIMRLLQVKLITGSISLLGGLYFLFTKARNIYQCILINENGLEIKGHSSNLRYHHEDLGDLKIQKDVFRDMDVITLTSTHMDSGIEVLIMRTFDSKKNINLFQNVATEMVQIWDQDLE